MRLGRPLWKFQQPQGAIQVVPKLGHAVVHPRLRLEKKGMVFYFSGILQRAKVKFPLQHTHRKLSCADELPSTEFLYC